MPYRKNRNILFVDDEKLLVQMVSEQLEEEGFSVTPAYNGEMALKVLKSGVAVDLIVSDIKMPRMDGVALLKQVRTDFPNIPICMASGYADHSEQTILALGAFAYISKPYSLDSITAIADQIFGAPIPDTPVPGPDNAVVYVVEDDELDQSLLKRVFSQQNQEGSISLKFFVTGEDLLKEMRSASVAPALLILDINLPGISGLETLTQLQAEKLLDPRTPVIVLSSSSLKKDHDRAKELGVSCIYQKPSSRDSWWHIARAICQSWVPRGLSVNKSR